MKKLIEITSHAEVITEIIGQFAFMKIMSIPEDNNFKLLEKLSLNDVYEKADNYFIEFVDDLGMIITNECNLPEKISKFLQEWQCIADVTAIQQNIHYRLSIFDKEINS